MKAKQTQHKYNVLVLNVHGLLRGSSLELGRDADTGGQTKYVIEYVKELGRQPQINHVYVMTRKILDKRYADEYAQTEEHIEDNVTIFRVKCGGKRYIKKERLWPLLDEFVDHAISTIIEKKLKFDFIHSHYADSGYIAMEISKFLNVPFIHTGHSLGAPKRKKLLENNVEESVMEHEYNLKRRIEVEDKIIQRARLIVTSTREEIDRQYSMYESHKKGNYEVIPPGIDLSKFYPYYYLKDATLRDLDKYGITLETRESIRKELRRFLVNGNKPLILTICRPEKRKNIEGLIEAYGEDKELQLMANLAIFAGIRKDISQKNRSEQQILMDMLLLMDKYDLYGKMAIPKKHDFEHEIPELYRFTAELGGVFVNPAYIEPFGLTLFEAAASGLPIVSTDSGGPVDIVEHCKNGLLVNVQNHQDISQAIKRIIADREMWEKYSRNGSQNVKQYYSWDSHCSKLISLLEQKHIIGENKVTVQPTISFKDKLFSFEKLIITDIDNTLIGDDKALSRFLSWFSDNRANFGLGVATGRNLESALGILKEKNVPVPDILITSVGTEIYYHHSGQYIPDKGWSKYLSEGWKTNEIRDALKKYTYLTPQEDMRRFKVSYYVKDCTRDRISKIHRELRKRKLKYKLILTENYYLDILPNRASKYKAIVHVGNKWKLSMDDILVAGDSGNDREMLREMKNAVVVANHKQELKRLTKTYFSDEGYAGAIVDGLRHFRFI